MLYSPYCTPFSLVWLQYKSHKCRNYVVSRFTPKIFQAKSVDWQRLEEKRHYLAFWRNLAQFQMIKPWKCKRDDRNPSANCSPIELQESICIWMIQQYIRYFTFRVLDSNVSEKNGMYNCKSQSFSAIK